MNKRDWFYIATLAVIAIAWWHHYENDKAVWNLWDDPRACTIEWDDGTYTYKSGIISLGTIGPGESKPVKCGPVDIDANGIAFGSTGHSLQALHEGVTKLEQKYFGALIWPDIFTNPDAAIYKDGQEGRLHALADGLSGWGCAMAGQELPELFGIAMMKIGLVLDVLPTPDELMRVHDEYKKMGYIQGRY